MRNAQLALDEAAGDSRRLATALGRGTARYVRSQEELANIRAVVRKWFSEWRPALAGSLPDATIAEVDRQYQAITEATAHRTLRAVYRKALRELAKALAILEAVHPVLLAQPEASPLRIQAQVPDFAPLVSDPRMRAILAARWQECDVCITHGAPLAAAVMIGGLLEGLFLARILSAGKQERDWIFRSASAPKDNTGKTRQLAEWRLKDFIELAEEGGWIGAAAGKLSDILRDYRNLIHPQKELSEASGVSAGDAVLMWGLAKQVIAQILAAR